MLEFLARHAGRGRHAARALLEHVWDENFRRLDERRRRLRRLPAAQARAAVRRPLIRTVRGVGFGWSRREAPDPRAADGLVRRAARGRSSPRSARSSSCSCGRDLPATIDREPAPGGRADRAGLPRRRAPRASATSARRCCSSRRRAAAQLLDAARPRAPRPTAADRGAADARRAAARGARCAGGAMLAHARRSAADVPRHARARPTRHGAPRVVVVAQSLARGRRSSVAPRAGRCS